MTGCTWQKHAYRHWLRPWLFNKARLRVKNTQLPNKRVKPCLAIQWHIIEQDTGQSAHSCWITLKPEYSISTVYLVIMITMSDCCKTMSLWCYSNWTSWICHWIKKTTALKESSYNTMVPLIQFPTFIKEGNQLYDHHKPQNPDKYDSNYDYYNKLHFFFFACTRLIYTVR